jgi:hypothetical protein
MLVAILTCLIWKEQFFFWKWNIAFQFLKASFTTTLLLIHACSSNLLWIIYYRNKWFQLCISVSFWISWKRFFILLNFDFHKFFPTHINYMVKKTCY